MMENASLQKKKAENKSAKKSTQQPSHPPMTTEPLAVNGEISQIDLLRLQRVVGNQAVQQIMRSQDTESTRHERGCGCPTCRSMMLKRDEQVTAMVNNSPLVQRVDEHEEDIAAKRVDIQRVDEHEEDIAAKRIQPSGHIQKKTPGAIVQWRVKPRIQRGWLSNLVKKIKSKKDPNKLGKGKKALKKALASLLKDSETVEFKDLKPLIAQATKSQKDAAWKDDDLLNTAKSKLSEDDYLNLLPALGMFKPGETAEDKKSHTRADKADKHIRNYLAPYVAEAVKAGRQVEGQVSVVDGDDWLTAYKREFGDDGEEDITNAFVDHPDGRIWIHKNRGNAGTIIHEGIHKYSTGDFLRAVGFNFNEGITEYFTRVICAELDYRRGNYESNYKFAKEFVDYLGEDNVAKAYFDGDVQALKTLYEDKGKNWDELILAVRAKEWADAKDMLK